MSDIILKTSRSVDEIEQDFKDMDIFSDLMDSLEEAVAYKKGTPKPGTVVRQRVLPTVNVVEIRESLSMTQRSFAAVLGVSCRTVEAWESGRSNPTPTAKKLLKLLDEDHGLVKKLLQE